MPDAWDVNPTDSWRSSLMANSAKDPFWRAKVAHEVAVNPSHQAELEYQLEQHRPHTATMQKTWLDASTVHVDIKSYIVVSRRDRSPNDRLTCGSKRRGILTLRRDDFNRLVHIQNSDIEERSWHFLRAQLETILLINWYRSPSVIPDGCEQL